MSNRRSLIGEVSLSKTSEKVWNKISGTVSFDMGEISFEGSIDFPLKSNIDVHYTTSLLGNASTLLLSGATWFSKIMGITANVSDFKILSWTPLEDDNYKYIVFPMYLEVGDNGDKGKMLYEYLTEKYPNSYSDGLPEKIYVNGDIKPYLQAGYKLTNGEDFYVLKADGSITYESHHGGSN